jgi:hypothetical protein
MRRTLRYGVGAHEPLAHRLRTGNTTADELERWRRETSDENLDLLDRLGVREVMIACSKGFGLEAEKSLIERAAEFGQRAARRGITIRYYIQGFPVYYETFLLERPDARDWVARSADGRPIPWGQQTFRWWIDPTRREFLEYQQHLLEYILRQFVPEKIFIDNTIAPDCYTHSARESFRHYLRHTFADADPMAQLGIPSFDAVELPFFDPIHGPPDSYQVVKDPLLQHWAIWRGRVTDDFVAAMRDRAHQIAPKLEFQTTGGCDGLRSNHLWAGGVDFDSRITSADHVHMEESGWRPGTAPLPAQTCGPEAPALDVRVSTDSRWWKLYSNYGKAGHSGLWGETTRQAKLVALAHHVAFAQNPHELGYLGPLAAHPQMLDDIADVLDWLDEHGEILTDREGRLAPLAVWRSTATIGFIRHRPVWEACSIEQMLYENHRPFTILLDGGLERFLAERSVLILPGCECVSDEQVETITSWVASGGRLLLAGPCGTRDERVRLRRRLAFEHIFGGSLGQLESFGPPHWVPELDWNAAPARATADFGRGRVTLIKDILPRTELDLTRDPYSPFRVVAPRDILPPANEMELLGGIDELAGGELPGVTAPRHTLCEFWRSGTNLRICLANLDLARDGGPVEIVLPPHTQPSAVRVHRLLQAGVQDLPADRSARLERLERFAAVEFVDALAGSGGA